MAQDKKNILIGAGTLVAGTDNLGYTRDGVTISKSGEFLDVHPDQVTYPILNQKTSETYQVSTNLLEITLENLKIAWGESAAVVGGNSLKLGTAEVDVTEHVLVFNGLAPKNLAGKYGDRTVTFHRASAMEYGEMAMTRDGETIIPVTFTCLYDAEEECVGQIVDAEAT